jgi:predicted transposase YdaD
VKDVKDLFPEYYILCVKEFNDVAKSSLDEWLYYFKNDTIPARFKAPGLKEARKQLRYDKLSEQEKSDYLHHLDQQLYERSAISTAIWKGQVRGEAKGLAKGRAEGLAKGRAEGLTEGEAKGRAAERVEIQKTMAVNSYQAGISVETISDVTGLTREQIIDILKCHGLIQA